MSDFEIRGTAEQKAQFFAAMALAQSQFRAVNKTRTVHVRSEKGSYTFDYAPLDEVFDATLPALNANGFAVFQPLSTTEAGVSLRLLITHAAGAELECCSVLSRQGKMQEMGSQITYMRRYMYQAAVGVVAEEDDDGNAGDGNQRDVQPRNRQSPPSPPKKVEQTNPTRAAQNGKPADSPVATPVPPQVAVSAPSGPSPEAGANVPPSNPGISDDQTKEISALLRAKAWPDSAGKPFREKNPKTGVERWAIVNTNRANEICTKVCTVKTLAAVATSADAFQFLNYLRDLPDMPQEST